ncbi:hypothetical protein BDB00DRAFT_824674 [Zychaea mexicana]|uniref:uncharacterized protein n=1 Tax=Zychaea mexicana TaxID=64656 RepID=UPI0022FE52A5|nr:uncharacterized protein BDB00DRAFT_824674 [Zychaea mexicana]KAI9493171.1 hypothetical protein BDB00DRAFT_824674 [Zychaea mexicana]
MAEKNKSTPVKNLVSNKLSSTTAAGTATTTTTTTATVSGDKVENDIKGTQLCQYYRAGNCARKEACTFAHEDTSRVVICREWKKGFNQCKNGNKCKFLHTEKQAGGERDTSLRKTKLCIYYKTGDCPRTEQQCNFAHEDISKVQKREAWDGFECPDDDECALLHANDRTQLEQSSSPLQPVKRVDLGDEEAFPDLGSGKHNDDGGKYLANETAVSKVNERNNGESYAIAARLRPATVKTSPPSAQFRTAKKSTMERQEDDNTFSASTSSEGSSLNRKTKICEYFRKGNCVFDEESCHYAHEDLSRVHLCYAYLNSHKCEEVLCPYLHQERDINIDIDVDQPARKTKLCLSFLQQKCPYKNEEDCEFAHKDTRKVPICKYWRSNGLCLKDKHCQFLHEEPVVENIDDLIAGALDVKGYPVLTERMKELLIKNVIRSDYNYATAARREPAVSPPPACQPKEKKISCVDETGRAPRGGVIRTHVLHLSDDDNESCAESDEKELRHTKKCRLWWNTDEKCSRYNCWYAHDDTSKVKDCYFWRKGYCSNDTACLYMHRPQDRIDVKYICELPDLSDEDEDNVSMSSSLEDESAMTSEKIRKCSHFWYGAGCTRKSSVCRYAHEDLQYVSTCYYWQNKKECPSGSACAYKHGESPRELEWDDNARKDIFAKSPPSSSLQQTASGQRAMWLNKLRTPPSPETLPRVASGSENNELRYKSMRAQAFKYGEKMNMETERAAKARQEGNQEEAETHECRALEYSRWMNREHAKASQAIFNACNSDPRHRSRFIDLHGQHVTEAKQHIKRWFDDFQKQRDVVYIVTGAGRHSRKNAVNKGQLRKAIQEYLENMYMCHETHVHGDDSGGVFAVLFCVHEYTSKHSRQCLKCPYYRKQSQQ